MAKLFGTDGVRGLAGSSLTPELAFALGQACSHIFLQGTKTGERPKIMVGKDTRISGDMLEAALVAGICSTGADALLLGTIPTAAVAYLTRIYQANCGAVISASHNPYYDNGIKFFGADGYKLSDDLEDQIEAQVLGNKELKHATHTTIGRVCFVEEAKTRYLEFLLGCLEKEGIFEQLSIVVDCANGAAFETAPALWKRLGAKALILYNQPDGVNINEECGSTHLEHLKKAVLENKADLGIAYDGDADRCLAIDEQGNEVDGDAILTICGLHMQRTGRLTSNQVVGTVMSNLGLNLSLENAGIKVHNSQVGDRYVIEKMKQTGAILGGEQSGHIIFHRHATTGDGILTSLMLGEVMQQTGKPLSILAAEMHRLPQVLVNVNIQGKENVINEIGYQTVLSEAETKLGSNGKLLVRASGTEPLIRILAQGTELEILQQITADIKQYIDEYRQ